MCYVTKEYFFDIHPPLAKLLLYVVGQFGVWQGYQVINVDHDYQDGLYVLLRGTAAFFGSLVVPLVYLTARYQNLSRFASLFAAWLTLTDNLFILESRSVLTEPFLLFFEILSLCLSSALLREKPFTRKWLIISMLTGLSLGGCVSTKLTSLGVIATVGLQQFIHYVRRFFLPLAQSSRPENTTKIAKQLLQETVLKGSLMFFGMVLVLSTSWFVHFHQLRYFGPHVSQMSSQFQSSFLEYRSSEEVMTTPHCYSDSPANYQGITFPPMAFGSSIGLLGAVAEVNHLTYLDTLQNGGAHFLASRWNEWPLMNAHLIPFYYGRLLSTGERYVFFSVGNPFSWWLSLFLVVFSSGFLVLIGASSFFSWSGVMPLKPDSDEIEDSKEHPSRVPFEDGEEGDGVIFVLALHVFGYYANWLPFSLVPRSTYLYHYLPSLMFAFLTAGTCVDLTLLLPDIVNRIPRDASSLLPSSSPSSSSDRGGIWITGFRLWWIVVMVFASLCYLYFSPWTYGLGLSLESHQARLWLQSWIAHPEMYSQGRADLPLDRW